MNPDNLNHLATVKAQGEDVPFQDNSTTEGDVSVIFKNLKGHLIKEIQKHNLVVGCVAWLTDFDILRALSKVENVIIIVQKEDFLRPDIKSGTAWPKTLRRFYDNLNCDVGRHEMPHLRHLSVCSWVNIPPVVCVGNHNTEKHPAFPRMHNKFLVFGEVHPISRRENEDYAPNAIKNLEAVWTGSFNFTQNATRSLENAVLIRNPKIAKAYYREFAQIFSVSELLDWGHPWVAPEYRIGT